MKLAKSFEQGVCLIAILATQAKAIPVLSRTLQRRLPTSMTYSQKLLRKLVVAGIVKSVPGNNGGFALARPIRADFHPGGSRSTGGQSRQLSQYRAL